MAATDVLATLLHLNLAAAAAVLAVLAVRPMVRRQFGAEIAYRLWICVPVAALSALLPAAAATRIVPPGLGWHFDPVYSASQSLALAPARPILALWLLGLALGLTIIAYCQLRFLRMARRGRAGPAVTGFFVPRIIMPGDAESRYSPEERALIRAHERTHIDRGDPRTNGFIARCPRCLLLVQRRWSRIGRHRGPRLAGRTGAWPATPPSWRTVPARSAATPRPC